MAPYIGDHVLPLTESAGREYQAAAVPTQPKPGSAPLPLPLPEVNDEFLGFRIIGELGRGAFGRVYLARQGGLADRLVALKVCVEAFDETQTLAQLQHSNIVPVYSSHTNGQLQAVCMPYFGPTTLADVLKDLRSCERLPTSGAQLISSLRDRRSASQASISASRSTIDGIEPAAEIAFPSMIVPLLPESLPTLELLKGYSYVYAVLWLGARLADGLAHAHERGVVHRDLKPANVLLADDGRPMLLDFNLSTSPGRVEKLCGGTIPYMAPEQLTANDVPAVAIDARADIFALGLILYELLAAKPAYPWRQGHFANIKKEMLADRLAGPPPMRLRNLAVTPAVEAIVRRCLAYLPEDRYACSADLREDLERHLIHLPLRHAIEPSRRELAAKWVRRHPRATSTGTLAAIACGLLLVFGLALWSKTVEVNRRAAQDQQVAFLTEAANLQTALIRTPEPESDSGARERALAAVNRYQVDRPDWASAAEVTRLTLAEQSQLRTGIGEMLILLGQSRSPSEALVWNDRAKTCYDDATLPRMWTRQRADILKRLGRGDEAAQILDSPLRELTTATDHYMEGLWSYEQGRYESAIAALNKATGIDPRHYAGWLLLGYSRYMLRDDAGAMACFNTCIGLNPKNGTAYFRRGRVSYRIGKYAEAEGDYAEAQALGFTKPEVAFDRCKSLVHRKRLAEAEAILTAMIDDGTEPLRTHFARADVRHRLGDRSGAAADRAAGMKLAPKTGFDFNERGLERLRDDPNSALADFREATRMLPDHIVALLNQASVLSERLSRPAEAVGVLDRLIEQTPEFPPAVAGRAVLLARLGRTDEALRDAKLCLKKYDHPMIRYQIAGVYALTSAGHPERATEALRLIASALKERGTGSRDLPADPDLDPIRKLPEFKKLLDAWAALNAFD